MPELSRPPPNNLRLAAVRALSFGTKSSSSQNESAAQSLEAPTPPAHGFVPSSKPYSSAGQISREPQDYDTGMEIEHSVMMGLHAGNLQQSEPSFSRSTGHEGSPRLMRRPVPGHSPYAAATQVYSPSTADSDDSASHTQRFSGPIASARTSAHRSDRVDDLGIDRNELERLTPSSRLAQVHDNNPGVPLNEWVHLDSNVLSQITSEISPSASGHIGSIQDNNVSRSNQLHAPMEDEDATVLMNAINASDRMEAAQEGLDQGEASHGAHDLNAPKSSPDGYLEPPPHLHQSASKTSLKDRLRLSNTSPLSFMRGSSTSSKKTASTTPNIDKQKKVMSAAEFQAYRRNRDLAPRQRTGHDSDSDEDFNYDDHDELQEITAVKQRQRQEAHLSVYRQQMRKIAGQDVGDPSVPGGWRNSRVMSSRVASSSAPDLLLRPLSGMSLKVPGLGGKQGGEEEDEEVPLAVLAAHGFPNKARPPAPPSHVSSPNLHMALHPSAYPPPAGSVLGHLPNRARLPAFASRLPSDPYRSVSVAGQSVPLNTGVPQNVFMPPAYIQQAQHGGLVGVIAGEERARAMRRGSAVAAVPASPMVYRYPAQVPTNQAMQHGGDQQLQMQHQMEQFMQMQHMMMQQMAQMQHQNQMLQHQLEQQGLDPMGLSRVNSSGTLHVPSQGRPLSAMLPGMADPTGQTRAPSLGSRSVSFADPRSSEWSNAGVHGAQPVQGMLNRALSPDLSRQAPSYQQPGGGLHPAPSAYGPPSRVREVQARMPRQRPRSSLGVEAATSAPLPWVRSTVEDEDGDSLASSRNVFV